MGCNVSKPEGVEGEGGEGGEIINKSGAGESRVQLVRPIIRQKIFEEIRRRRFILGGNVGNNRPTRKDSIVSTTELLGSQRVSPDVVDFSDGSPADDSVGSSNEKIKLPDNDLKKIEKISEEEEEEDLNYLTAAEEEEEHHRDHQQQHQQQQEEEEEENRNGAKLSIRSRTDRLDNQQEELFLGSPSFRFYFQQQPEFGEGSVKAPWINNNNNNNKEEEQQVNVDHEKEKKKKKKNSSSSSSSSGEEGKLLKKNEQQRSSDRDDNSSHESSSESHSSSEDSVKKSVPKHKGKVSKLRRGLSKGRNTFYKLLNIRNCYSQINTSHVEAATAAGDPRQPQRLLSGKAS